MTEKKKPSPPYLNKHFHLKNSQLLFRMREELSMIPSRNYQKEKCYEHLHFSSAIFLQQGVNFPLLTEIFSAYLTAEKAQKEQILVKNWSS